MVQPKMVYLSHHHGKRRPLLQRGAHRPAPGPATSTACTCSWTGPGWATHWHSPQTDVTLPDLARLCHVFYIGGTKWRGPVRGGGGDHRPRPETGTVRYAIKQNGGMLAKGRLLGLQFLTLFTGGLYQQICQKAVQQAFRIADACQKAGDRDLRPLPHQPAVLHLPPTNSSGGWRRSTSSPSGRRWTRAAPPCGSAPAGPPGTRPWTSSIADLLALAP